MMPHFCSSAHGLGFYNDLTRAGLEFRRVYEFTKSLRTSEVVVVTISNINMAMPICFKLPKDVGEQSMSAREGQMCLWTPWGEDGDLS